MINSYLGLLIFFAVQHQVSSLSADEEYRKHTQTIKKDMMKELQNIQRRSEIRQDPIDNYDLIVRKPSETLIKPFLRHRHRHRHRHHRLRSGRGVKVPIKHDKTHKPLKDANTQRKNFNLTGETNMTQIQGYKNATTKNDLNEYQRRGEDVYIQKEKDAATDIDLNKHRSGRENEATTLKQKHKYAITKNYLNANWRGGEKVATMQIEKNKDSVAKNYLSEHQKGIENEAATLIQKDKNATTRTYLNENRKGEEKVATKHIQKNKDVKTKKYLYKSRSGRENEAKTQTQEVKDATTTNYLNEHRRGRKNVATRQIKEDKDTTTKNDFYENRSGRENKATTQIQKEKDATTTNYLIDNWREGEKIATTSQKPVKKSQKVTPKVPFYRRVNYLNDQERNKPQKWVHCLDLVGPRLKGYKDNWRPKQKTDRHTDIKRLAELLNTDVSQYTEAEIISLLSQISNIDLRLFQWDYTAITTIINIIIRGTIHSFKALKTGVKYLFAKWHLDTSMLKTFLEQTRILRPPCLDISGTAGYTKKAGGILLFTKPVKSTKKHRGGDESCHSREISTVNNNNY